VHAFDYAFIDFFFAERTMHLFLLLASVNESGMQYTHRKMLLALLLLAAFSLQHPQYTLLSKIQKRQGHPLSTPLPFLTSGPTA